MGGARCYVILFEAPFQASVLNDSENNALRASSLMAIPPPPPGTQPLAGSTVADLLGNNLTQWASDVQEVTSYMQWPLEAAMRCPLTDIIGVLSRLEGLTRVPYCRSCFGIGPGCQCSAVPRVAPGPMAALWTPPTLSYSAMVSSTETTASTSAAGGFHRQHPLPLVSVRRDLRHLNSRHPLQESRKQCKQHLIDNRCSHLNALPPNRAPPPVPAKIKETWLERLEVPGVGPHPEGLRIGKEEADPPPEDLGSADGLTPLTT